PPPRSRAASPARSPRRRRTSGRRPPSPRPSRTTTSRPSDLRKRLTGSQAGRRGSRPRTGASTRSPSPRRGHDGFPEGGSMAAYAADGSRVERLLARLRRTEETHRSALDAIEEARRTGRMSKWNAQLATNYHSGLHEGTRSARLVVQEGLDESLTTTLSGRPQVVYGTGALLSRMIDAAAERDMEVSELLSALTCEHELVEVELL